MLSQSRFLSLDPNHHSSFSPNFISPSYVSTSSSSSSALSSTLTFAKPRRIISMSTTRSTLSNGIDSVTRSDSELDQFAIVANKLADAAGDVIRKYFRKRFDIVDKPDLSPVTIADRAAEEAMISIIQHSFPSHAIYGEENGWQCKEESADYVWVLDPIDGTKSFITGKPLFGTLIALLHKGKPV